MLKLTDMPSWSLPPRRLLCQIKVQTAMTANWAARNTVPATIKPAMLIHIPASPLGIKTASVPVFVVLFVPSKPNLSVICMVCTRSMSSCGVVAALLLRLLPYEITDLSSPVDSSWSHWTGSQVGMQGVTRARNWTTSEEGNLKASKWERRTCNKKLCCKLGSGFCYRPNGVCVGFIDEWWTFGLTDPHCWPLAVWVGLRL